MVVGKQQWEEFASPGTQKDNFQLAILLGMQHIAFFCLRFVCLLLNKLLKKRP
jgi:hypothetical protein